jgi:CubicO group peptidase (beta-lactamase class C family)
MSLKQDLDELLRRASDAGEVPGVIVAVADRTGTTYEGAFGKRVLGQDAAMSLDTVVLIASMTKALTTTAAMQLVERGKLDLDSPVSRWVPQIGEAQVLLGFDASGEPRTRPPQRPITLRHLLTHSAGFGYEIFSADIQRYQSAKKLPGIFTCQNAALGTPLLFDPGDRWEYGINLDWAGKAIEAVSGQSLGSYLKQHVFAPLGMNDTAFKISASMRKRLAKIHQRGDDGRLAAIDLELPQEPEYESGGHGLYGTAGDYQKFMRMILQRGRFDGAQVLKAETVDMMTRNQIGKIQVPPLKTFLPQISNDADFFPGLAKYFSFGFMVISARTPTGLPAGGLMWAGIANTYFWIDPTKNVTGVFMTQILPFADAQAGSLFLNVQQAVYRSID